MNSWILMKKQKPTIGKPNICIYWLQINRMLPIFYLTEYLADDRYINLIKLNVTTFTANIFCFKAH